MLSPGITYRDDFKCWWPNYDKDPEKNFNWVQHFIRDLEHTVRICKKKRVCVQAGGHAGLWPMRLAKHFEVVHTYEPEPALYACIVNNIRDWPNIHPHGVALGDVTGEVRMRPHCTAGSWRVDEEGIVPVFQTTIDAKGLNHCDAIFLDVEGYEVQALMGAARTIEKFSPVLHLEELPRSKEAIQKHVTGLGYRKFMKIHNDVIYVRH